MKKLETKTILQKYIAQSGHCSRRQAEELIRTGKVLVNGQRAELGMSVIEADEIRVKGRLVKPAFSKNYIALNKPAGYTCTNRKFAGEKNVFDLINLPDLRLFTVGRLDKDSRGLVLLTDDGDLAQRLTHPKFEHEKEYLIRIGTKYERIGTNHELNAIARQLKKGVDIGDGDGIARMKKVEYEGEEKFRVVLTEGKKRQIRRMFAALGFEVCDIQRVRIGKLELGSLKEGKWRCIEKKDIID